MLTDDRLQQELSAAFHSEADPVTRLTSPPGALWRQAVRYRRRRIVIGTGGLAAAAATAVVIALAAGALGPAPSRAPTATATQKPPAGRHPAPGNQAGGNQAGAGALLAAKVAKAPPAAAAASGMPSLYAIADHGQPTVEIRDAATGNLLSTVPLPASIDPKLTLVTGSGDDRTFVVHVFSTSGGTGFYELKVSAGGHSSGLTRLTVPLPGGQAANAIALSPDGTRLAVATETIGLPEGPGTIEVVDLATGAVRTWAASANAMLKDLTWDGSGRHLAYLYDGDFARTNGLWQLDTRARETALPAGRRLLPQAVGSDEVQDALLTPDGQHIIASVTYNGLSDVTANTIIGGIVQLSAQGQPLQILLAQRAIPSRQDYEATSCQLASVDPTGEHLLVSCAPAFFGRLDRARFTGLPVAGSVGIAAAAW